jgi:hypothetical protein
VDYLSAQFIAQGWSIKKMHRLIMLSNTYQQSSANNPRYALVDPNNRLLWRANVHRLEFEALRDSFLAIGGDLNKTMFGRPVELNREPYSTRRTIYGRVDRSDVADVLVNFDFANPDLPSGRRHETTVPQQALFLMNSPLVVEQARKLVATPPFVACRSDEDRVGFLYERIYQRPPSEEETKLGLEFVGSAPPPAKIPVEQTQVRKVSNEGPALRPKQAAKQGMRKGAGPEFRQRAPLKGWEEYAHALMQANEASFVN